MPSRAAWEEARHDAEVEGVEGLAVGQLRLA